MVCALALSLAACALFSPSPAATPTASPVSSAPVYFLMGAEYLAQPWDIVALNGAMGRLLWRHATGGDGSGMAPIAAGGVVYALTTRTSAAIYQESVLQAFRASDGALLWEYFTMGHVYQEPIISGGLVYLNMRVADIQRPGVLVALRASNGDVAWRTAFPAAFSALTLAGGLVIVTGDNRLTALHATTGAAAWDYAAAHATKVGGIVINPPLVMGSMLVFEYIAVSLDMPGVFQLLALDVSTGDTLWTAPISGSLSSTILSGGTLYLTSTQFDQSHTRSTVYAVNPLSGATLWTYPAPTNKVYSAPVAAGSAITLTESGPTLNGAPSATGGGALALDGATGRLLWHTQLGATVLDVSFISPLVSGGVICAFLSLTPGGGTPGVATLGQVAAMSLSDGALRWRKDIPLANASPLVQGGALYTFTYNDHSPLGEVTAIRLGDGATVWQYKA